MTCCLFNEKHLVEDGEEHGSIMMLVKKNVPKQLKAVTHR